MIDREKLKTTLLDLLAIPSPSGFTDEIVGYIGGRLEQMGVEFDITRRGTVRALLPGGDGASDEPAQAVICHVDTIGAMVRQFKPSGRLLLAPVGYWSSRFAEGTRVTLFTEKKAFRGTLLPCVKWGVSRDAGVDLRLDEPVTSPRQVQELGIDIGDFIALDTNAEVLSNGFVVGRNLDNKAGAAAVLQTIESVTEQQRTPARDTYFLFTVTETVGSGAGSAILPEVSELVTVDFASEPWAEQHPFEHLTIASGDAAGPSLSTPWPRRTTFPLSAGSCRPRTTMQRPHSRPVTMCAPRSSPTRRTPRTASSGRTSRALKMSALCCRPTWSARRPLRTTRSPRRFRISVTRSILTACQKPARAYRSPPTFSGATDDYPQAPHRRGLPQGMPAGYAGDPQPHRLYG